MPVFLLDPLDLLYKRNNLLSFQVLEFNLNNVFSSENRVLQVK